MGRCHAWCRRTRGTSVHVVRHVPVHLVLDVYNDASFDVRDGGTANRDNNSAHGAKRAHVALKRLARVVAVAQLPYEPTLLTGVYEDKRTVLAILPVACAAELEVREVFVVLEMFDLILAFGDLASDIFIIGWCDHHSGIIASDVEALDV